MIFRIIATAALTVTMAVTSACDDSSPTAPSPIDPLAGFTLSGDPGLPDGAMWTYAARVEGVEYDLSGVLIKPPGSGPFPAVVISHGAGGSSLGYSRRIGRVMATWGLVCMAVNYTHAGGVPIGSPGTSAEPGASRANVLRARRLVAILRGLGYVDDSRLALHGHSLGAFVTTAVAAAYPDLFRVASHTAGGILPDLVPLPAPTEADIASIRAPYQIHHGDRDFVVPLVADQLFARALERSGVTHELVVHAGADHDDVSTDPAILERIRDWYRRHGLF